MEHCRILRILLLMCLTLPVSLGYVLTGPKILQTETYETFCVSLEGALTPANCTLQLTSLDREVVHSTTQYRIKGLKDCFKVYVPSVNEHAARVVWQMNYDDGQIPPVTTSKEIGIQKLNLIHLIQTDKAWYTPGQIVRFRVLILNHLLQTVREPINKIWIEDPTGTTVSQWTNVTSPQGLHQMELTLSSEPVQGLWKIRMEKSGLAQMQKEFEVREYVLPRFEVSIVAPEVITYREPDDQSTQKITITICAKYSYGQPVKGEWKANVTVINNTWSRYAQSTKIEMDRKGSLNSDTGCGTLKLPGNDLGIGEYDGFTQKTIDVTAVVIEKGTGIEKNSTWSTTVKQRSVSVDMNAWSATAFKNGLPFYGIAKVSSADGQPLGESTVELCVQPSYDHRVKEKKTKKMKATHHGRKMQMALEPGHNDRNRKPAAQFCSIRQTSSNGVAEFVLFPSEPDLMEFVVKARVLGSNRNITKGESQFTIQKSFSPSGSFIVFVPPQNYPQPVTCRNVLPIKLLFNTDKEVNLDVHYMVIGRGDVIATGIKQVKFREEDNIDLNLGDALLSRKLNDEESEFDEPTVKLIGELEFEIEILPEFSPKVSILAYYVRQDREVVTASIEIPIQNCFPNPVQMTWTPKRKQPGKMVNLHLKSTPGSLCGYSVVDQSVTFIRPELHLSESNVYSVLPMYHINSGAWPYQVTPQYEYCHKHENPFQEPDAWIDDLRRRKRSFVPWGWGPQLKDAMDAFDRAGIFIMTDLKVETRPCIDSGPRFMKFRARFLRPDNAMMLARSRSYEAAEPAIEEREYFASATLDTDSPDEGYSGAPELPSADTIRTYFPETWLWDLATLNDQGELKRTVELPHTITTWSGRALCVSEANGFGLSSAAEVQAFQPFFIEIHLPYSVKRTEKSEVKVSAFNYASHDLPVRLTLAYSEQYELLNDSDTVQICLPAGESVTHQFLIMATELGTHNLTVSITIDDTYNGVCGPEILPTAIDTVIKELLVIPEGFPVEQVFSHMACPKEYEEDKTVEWNLRLPDDLVEGSARAWVTAVGDLMGPALQGLTGLVRMPTGCGEQNMVLFTPIIYVMQYLTSTGQLDTAVKEKAINYMKSGYQRELTYRHADGSYSAFGKMDAEGSLWLTAFVVKSFAAARKFIHIDEAELHSSIRWLQLKQLENGCFPVIGTVLHKELKGGIDNDDGLTSLTAFTLISMLESLESLETDVILDKSTLRKKLHDSLLCIEPEDPIRLGVYTTALTAYALTLLGRTDAARSRIDWLMTQAKTDGSLLWWEKQGSGPALSVETTSYVLLSLTRLGNKEDLMNARSIVRWLSKQRNSEGGFVSTQDTVVALQAIASYATQIGTEETDMKLVISAGDTEHYTRIRQHDRMVQRRFDLPTPLPPSVKVENVGEGKGCAILQATLRYNIKTPPPAAAFDLSVSTRNINYQGTCNSHELKICTRYLGSLNQSSNMALIEVEFVSGHEVDKEATMKRNRHAEMKRIEANKDKLVLYFDQIAPQSPLCISIISNQVFKVNDAKEANVKIFDYYQPDLSQSVAYRLDTSGECVIVKEENELVKRSREVIVNSTLGGGTKPGVQVEEVETLGQPVFAELAEPRARSASLTMRHQEPGDLEVPEGIEGPIPIFSLPDQQRGCPSCYEDAPTDFQKLYCQSKTAYWAETRPARHNRLRLISEVTHHLAISEKRNASIDLTFEVACKCNVLEGQEQKGITVLGLPEPPYPVPPAKLLTGPEVVLINKTPKQLNIKSIRTKCAGAPKTVKTSKSGGR